MGNPSNAFAAFATMGVISFTTPKMMPVPGHTRAKRAEVPLHGSIGRRKGGGGVVRSRDPGLARNCNLEAENTEQIH